MPPGVNHIHHMAMHCQRPPDPFGHTFSRLLDELNKEYQKVAAENLQLAAQNTILSYGKDEAKVSPFSGSTCCSARSSSQWRTLPEPQSPSSLCQSRVGASRLVEQVKQQRHNGDTAVESGLAESSTPTQIGSKLDDRAPPVVELADQREVFNSAGEEFTSSGKLLVFSEVSDEASTEQEVPSPSTPNPASRGSHSIAYSMRSNTKLAISNSATSVQLEDYRPMFGSLEIFVRSNWFEVICTSLVVLSVLILAVQGQQSGMQVGADIGFPRYDAWLWDPKELFQSCEFIFGCIFTVELVLKVACFRVEFLFDAWNFMDSGIVIAWLVEVMTTQTSIISPFALRLLRMFRLLRLVRLVRSLKQFDSLVIMTTAMQGSMAILFWSIIVLTLVLMMCALFLQTMVMDFLVKDEPARIEVFMYYGTFSRALLTMFEITLGNWMPPCRALVENVNEWYLIFFILHKLMIGFSVLAVINGVFIQETFKVANQDDRLMMLHKERATRDHARKMHALFSHLDEDGDDTLTLEEFHGVHDDPRIKMWLSAMELEVQDVDKVFELLDRHGRQEVSVDDLVSGAAMLKGPARNIDVAFLLQKVDMLLGTMEKIDLRTQNVVQPEEKIDLRTQNGVHY